MALDSPQHFVLRRRAQGRWYFWFPGRRGRELEVHPGDFHCFSLGDRHRLSSPIVGQNQPSLCPGRGNSMGFGGQKACPWLGYFSGCTCVRAQGSIRTVMELCLYLVMTYALLYKSFLIRFPTWALLLSPASDWRHPPLRSPPLPWNNATVGLSNSFNSVTFYNSLHTFSLLWETRKWSLERLSALSEVTQLASRWTRMPVWRSLFPALILTSSCGPGGGGGPYQRWSIIFPWRVGAFRPQSSLLSSPDIHSRGWEVAVARSARDLTVPKAASCLPSSGYFIPPPRLIPRHWVQSRRQKYTSWLMS